VRPILDRRANQGEKLNQQNLGRSLYASRNIKVGELFKFDDFNYRGPQTGLTLSEVEQCGKITYLRPLAKGEVLKQSHFSKEKVFPSNYRDFAIENEISLPVRMHDFAEIKRIFEISNFEFHLSYKELGGKLALPKDLAGNKFTLHLPDYCSSHSIIDPFSGDSGIRSESLRLINNGIDFANRLEESTGHQVEIVGSFSKHAGTDPDFYTLFKDFLDTFVANRAKLSLQWLPPIAWYFGGSVRLDVMNNLSAVNRILETDLPIVLDTSHLFLGSEYFGFDSKKVIAELSNQISWYHISAASGIDGEGNDFLGMSPEQGSVIKKSIQSAKPKVVEVWQGHLNNFEGFRLAIRDLYSLVNSGAID
jgi:N-acetylneuraminate synthase